MRPSESDLARARYVRTVLAWHGSTVTDLARLLGVSQPNASQKLRGVRGFKVNELVAIADAYGLDPAALPRPPELEPVLGVPVEVLHLISDLASDVPFNTLAVETPFTIVAA